MDTPTIQSRIIDLQDKVRDYAPQEDRAEFSFPTGVYSRTHLVIPFITFFLLVLFQPSFIMAEVPDENGEPISKLSFRKLLIAWTIFTIICFVLMFAYNYK